MKITINKVENGYSVDVFDVVDEITKSYVFHDGRKAVLFVGQRLGVFEAGDAFVSRAKMEQLKKDSVENARIS